MAQATYTVPSTATYRSDDGTVAQKFYEGAVVPIETAVYLNMPDAVMPDPRDFFSDEEQAAILSIIGGTQSDNYIDVPDGALAAAPTLGTLTAANTAILVRFRVARTFVLGKIGVYIGATSAGNVDAGVYTSDGTTWTRIASNGGTASGSVNTEQEIAMSASVTLEPGTDYWAAFVGSDATLTIARTNNALTNMMGHGNRVISKATSYPLPATITSPAKEARVPMFLLIT